jgi:hypothetical protein
MAKKLCEGKIVPVWEYAGKHKEYFMVTWSGTYRPKNVRRLRLTCPICGRRVMSSVILNQDGDLLIHSLPPHKPKGWWKKKKKRLEKTRKIR